MKKVLTLPALVLAGMVGLCIVHARADLEVSASVQIHAAADFEAPLAPVGAWVEVGSYGHCWHPTGVEVGWRPYCVGQWEWTDAGWFWVSDEPWAWACYHYGTWFLDPSIGWVWVPGIEWAPAWVYWRVGDSHIGWAPCAPHGVVVAPDLFAFVDIGHFHDHLDPSHVILRDQSIIRETKEINDPKRGPELAVVEKHVGKLKALPVREVDQKTHYPAKLSQKRPVVKEKTEPVPREKVEQVPRENQPAQERVVPSPRPSEPAVEPPRQPPVERERPSEPPGERGKDRDK